MPDYEGMILERQDRIEIWEDDPDSAGCYRCWWDDLPDEEFKEIIK